MSLTREENDRLTRVGPGTAMGSMMRQGHWIPAALSEKLVADGTPLRVRLLGENYVAFRSTDGRIGFFDEACPHRGASLALARNEDNSLRCIYHGWKFHVSGVTVEVPTQASHAAEFCKGVPLVHYPAREAGGIVWVWLGSGKDAPRFPDFEFTRIPASNRVVYKQTGNFNWLQAVETTMDSAHAGVLHQSHVASMTLSLAAESQAPAYEIEPAPGGFRYAGIRPLPDGSRYVRVNTFVLPWYGVIAPRQSPYQGGAVFFAIPIDDENSTYWTVRYRMDGPIEKDAITLFSDPADWPPAVPGDASNNWGQDRELMRNGHFTGFPQHITTEDLVIATSQGPIVDRTREYLNSGDGALVRLRRVLLQAIDDVDSETRAPNSLVDYSTLRGFAGVIPAGGDWRTLIA